MILHNSYIDVNCVHVPSMFFWTNSLFVLIYLVHISGLLEPDINPIQITLVDVPGACNRIYVYSDDPLYAVPSIFKLLNDSICTVNPCKMLESVPILRFNRRRAYTICTQ